MGGTRSAECLAMSKQIWEWAESQNCWISITHIPGIENVLADLRSRKFKDNLGWSLNRDIFAKICKAFGEPQVDLFASRLNHKIKKYVSWEPEPDNWRTDAFSFPWTNMFVYCFPPFSLLPRVWAKVRREGARAIIVAPHWVAQPWFPMLETACRRKLRFPRKPGNLSGQGSRRQSRDVQSLQETGLVAYLF